MARVWVTTNVRVNLFPRCQINMPKVSQRVLIGVMDYTVAREKEFAPVRTGALRNSIRRYVLGTEAGVVRAGGGNVDYAPFQEWGTIYNAPHPFVRPAADIALSTINAICGDISAELVS